MLTRTTLVVAHLLGAVLVEATELADGALWTPNAPQGYKIPVRLRDSKPVDGAQRKEVLYGPWSVPANGMVTKMHSGQGPCATACYVTAMEATIKYADTGKEALTEQGAWLHHTAIFGQTASGSGSRIWAAGNERPTLRLNNHYKYGIDWPSTNRISFQTELMSEVPNAINLHLSITYEFIPKTAPSAKQYKASLMHWNEVGNPAAKEGKYSFRSRAWSSTTNGKLLYALGHLHDGGTEIKLFINNKLACSSYMLYSGGKPKAVAAPAKAAAAKAPAKGVAKAQSADTHGNHGHSRRQAGHGDAGHGGHGGDSSKAHISNPGLCENFGEIKRGDTMSIEAVYDTSQYSLMTHNGHAEALMGNMRVYIGPT